MKAKLGTICMLLGALLLLGALGLLLFNREEAAAAEESSAQLLTQIQVQIQEKVQEETFPMFQEIPPELLTPEQKEMTVTEIDGYGYIGYLWVPALELELPVMDQWDYPRLRIAPCRYTGTVRGEDLVIMAHNYARHFGGLSNLSEGDAVTFTDMDGITTEYRVAAMDILPPDAVEEMVAGDFDLTLFTCTYGGQSRVTVYCDKAD